MIYKIWMETKALCFFKSNGFSYLVQKQYSSFIRQPESNVKKTRSFYDVSLLKFLLNNLLVWLITESLFCDFLNNASTNLKSIFCKKLFFFGHFHLSCFISSQNSKNSFFNLNKNIIFTNIHTWIRCEYKKINIYCM